MAKLKLSTLAVDKPVELTVELRHQTSLLRPINNSIIGCLCANEVQGGRQPVSDANAQYGSGVNGAHLLWL